MNTSALLHVVRPDASRCERCTAGRGGYLLEDGEHVRRTLCLDCLTALLRAVLAAL